MPPFDPARFDAAWARYLTAGEAAKPGFRSFLNLGASPQELDTAEAALGISLGPDLRHLLTLNNGQDWSKGFMLPGWELFDAARIVDEWKIWEDLYHGQFKPDGYTSEPGDPAIRGDEWWRLKWIPFCGDGGGNHLCIDMDPAEGGTPGQVISMWHDAEDRDLIAPSLTEFIEIIAADLESGALHWNEEWGGIYEKWDDDDAATPAAPAAPDQAAEKSPKNSNAFTTFLNKVLGRD